MTDIRANQTALIAVSAVQADARVNEVAAIALCQETPPLAGGAKVYETALITVSKEFVIPVIYVPISCGQFMATMPYWIGK